MNKFEEMDNQQQELSDQLYSMEFVIQFSFTNIYAIAEHDRALEEQETNVPELKREIKELRTELARMQTAMMEQQANRDQETERMTKMKIRQEHLYVRNSIAQHTNIQYDQHHTYIDTIWLPYENWCMGFATFPR